MLFDIYFFGFLIVEYQREQLESDLEKEKLETTRLKDIDKDLNKTKTTLNEMKIKLEKTTLELGKMEAKNKSLAKHDQVKKNDKKHPCFIPLDSGIKNDQW